MSTSQALWVSSDVAAIKLAERMGKDTFYKYIHSYGFGLRSGLEVPGETRGLLKPPQRWQPTTIGSVPMGQEVGVTPIQLVTMASTIANGGTYLPPHMILRRTDLARGSAELRPLPFRPGDQMAESLPEGAHRVVSTMTAAEMRKMMEGVVLYGTAKGNANLNGYSAGGKTGTAQKIDVRTRTYSKTKYVASFVGFAPVNNPAITIAVVIDSPSVGSHFGTAVSAPVFQELAQQVLEYLGVAHDEPLSSVHELAKSLPNVHEDISEPVEDLNALFAEVNDLPADDPLRSPAPQNATLPERKEESEQAAAAAAGVPAGEQSAPVPVPTFEGAAADPSVVAQQKILDPDSHPAPVTTGGGSVHADASSKLAVPSFLGATVRRVAEEAASTGLGLQMIGSGVAREQAPAPGTLVPAGTEVVVRFRR